VCKPVIAIDPKGELVENMRGLNMRKGRAARTPKKPADAEAGAALVRKFAIKLFDRDEEADR
jgi:hypothetical protein